MNGNDQPQDSLYDRVLRMWAVEETILHSYTGRFLAFQAALFLSAVIVLHLGNRPTWYTQFLFFAIVAAGLMTAILWALLSRDRAIAAEYLSDRLKRLEKGEEMETNVFTSFCNYRKRNNVWLELRSVLFDLRPPERCCQAGKQWGTRCILHFILPATLGLLWLCIVSIYAYLLTAPQMMF